MDINADYTPARWIDTAEVAKLIRKHLKAANFGVKFSVRIDRYAGGSSVDISWTDGPTSQQVEAIAAAFAGKRFDGMDDLSYSADQWYCAEHGVRVAETNGTGDDRSGPVASRCCAQAELVHMGAGHVSFHRVLSAELRAELEQAVAEETGEAFDGYKQVWGRFMSDLLWIKSEETSR